MPNQRDTAETTYLPTTGAAAHVGAMGFLAVLAYPTELLKRDMLVNALKAGLLKSILPQGGKRSALRKNLRKMPNRRIDNVTGMAVNRIATKRIPAAQMFHWLLIDGHMGSRKIKGEHPLSLNDCARIIDDEQEGPDGTSHIKHRIWAQSKPVIHLAHAYWTTVHRNTKPCYLQQNGVVDVWSLIQQPDWLPIVLERAEQTRKSLHLFNPKITISDAKLIHLLPE